MFDGRAIGQQLRRLIAALLALEDQVPGDAVGGKVEVVVVKPQSASQPQETEK